jgi:hypothetical protein
VEENSTKHASNKVSSSQSKQLDILLILASRDVSRVNVLSYDSDAMIRCTWREVEPTWTQDTCKWCSFWPKFFEHCTSHCEHDSELAVETSELQRLKRQSFSGWKVRASAVEKSELQRFKLQSFSGWNVRASAVKTSELQRLKGQIFSGWNVRASAIETPELQRFKRQSFRGSNVRASEVQTSELQRLKR